MRLLRRYHSLLIAIASLAALLCAAAAECTAAELPALKVSSDGRRLTVADGKAFFYLGDTAWELFHRLNRDETKLYLDDRAAKGFNVIQAVALAEYGGLTEPNASGDLPLVKNDPTQPVEAYFKHVDWVIDGANRRGMSVGLLPTWGDKFNKKWGQGPEIFTPENARSYGEFLGKRYKDRGIIWILGGDRNPETDAHKAIIRAMAAGLRAGDGGGHLMTYHPQGRTASSSFFHDDKWLDFNMFQSGHNALDYANDEYTARDYARTPVKPTLDGEPRYEDHPVRSKPSGRWFDEYDTRQAMYWSVLAGACGHTYGNHNLWQMHDGVRKQLTDARTPWREALQHAGAAQVGYAKRLFESRPFLTLVPDDKLVTIKATAAAADHPRSARDKDGSYALIYAATGQTFEVDLTRLSGEKLRASWFDPRTGTMQSVGEFAPKGKQQFTPPTSGRGNDWLLILDDTAKKYPVW